MQTKAQFHNPVIPLPDHHFAILIEGAWIFTPDPKYPDRILATCPIVTNDHVCEFGIWDGGLGRVPGLNTTIMPINSHFSVETSQVDSQATSFTEVFDRAAEKYPIVYMRSDSTRSQEFKVGYVPNSGSERTISIPLPTCVRAAGALVTAEVKGADKTFLFGGEVTAKRAFVTLLFIYNYSGSLQAQVSTGSGSGEISANAENPTPHLIFRISPLKEKMIAMGGAMPMNPDDSCLKNHASDVFEMIRQSITATRPTRGKTSRRSPLDIALYHDEDPMRFDPGDTGLKEDELGLTPGRSPFGPKLPSCSGGGPVVNPTPPPPGSE